MSEAPAHGLTYTDLERMPDDGNRYELVDVCPPALRVRTAPLDVLLADGTCVQPDVLVAPVDQRRPVAGAAVALIVEITSPADGARRDRGWKRRRYERARIPYYWIVDPDPAVTVLALGPDGRYERVAHAVGDDVLAVDDPFPMRFRPADLLD